MTSSPTSACAHIGSFVAIKANGTETLALGGYYPTLMEAADVVRLDADSFRRNVGLQTGSRTITRDATSIFICGVYATHRNPKRASHTNRGSERGGNKTRQPVESYVTEI